MKKTIFLSLFIFFLSPMVWAQEKCEAPIWNVGDKWGYKDVTGATWTNEVLDVKEDLYIVKTTRSPDLNAYDKKTMNLRYLIEQSGKRIKATAPFKKIYDFPIFVGKKWTDTTTFMSPKRRLEETYINDFKIESVEEVTTPAGKFNTFKILDRQRNISYWKDGWIRFWYSPEAKALVKIEVEKTDYWSSFQSLQDAELISYELK